MYFHSLGSCDGLGSPLISRFFDVRLLLKSSLVARHMFLVVSSGSRMKEAIALPRVYKTTFCGSRYFVDCHFLIANMQIITTC